YSALTRPSPLNVAEVQQLLDDDMVLLEYALGEERSYLWAVTRSSVSGYELPKRDTVETAARRVYKLASTSWSAGGFKSQRAAQAEFKKASALLAQFILTPVAKQIQGKRLVIVADGALHYIPFCALPDPGKPAEMLLAGHEIVDEPSAS